MRVTSLSLSVGVILLALLVAFFPQKREHPCQKGSPPRAQARRQSKTYMSTFSTGGRDFCLTKLWLIFRILEAEQTEIVCFTHHIFYSSDFHFCLWIFASLLPFSPAAPVSYTLSVISSYISFSFSVMFSICFPTRSASCLMPTTDFFSFVDVVHHFSFFFRLCSYVFSTPSFFFLHDGDGWALWMSGLWKGLW